MEKLKVLVVADHVRQRHLLAAAVAQTDLGVVVHKASSGVLALERLSQQVYDVVLLAAVMPEMDGLAVLDRIKRLYPELAVIMIGDERYDQKKLALEQGALAFLLKPQWDMAGHGDELLRENLKPLFIRILNKQKEMIMSSPTFQEKAFSQPKPVTGETKKIGRPDIVLIAASTGGPEALKKVFGGLSGSINVPILVVQHMPQNFTSLLAGSLDRVCSLSVAEAHDGAAVEAGKVLLAPGGSHMLIRKKPSGGVVVELTQTELVNGLRPAADVLFQAVSEVYKKKKVLAVVLTGMGSDGRRGVAALKEVCDCFCITQSEASCLVYGMPRSVDEAGLSDVSIDIGNIAAKINGFCN